MALSVRLAAALWVDVFYNVEAAFLDQWPHHVEQHRLQCQVVVSRVFQNQVHRFVNKVRPAKLRGVEAACHKVQPRAVLAGRVFLLRQLQVCVQRPHICIREVFDERVRRAAEEHAHLRDVPNRMPPLLEEGAVCQQSNTSEHKLP